MYKIIEISKKAWEKIKVEVIVFNAKKWLNEKHIEEQLGHEKLLTATNQYSSELKKQRQEIQDCGKYQPCRRILGENFAIQIIMDRRITSAVNFKRRLGFNRYDPIMTQQQSILSKIVDIIFSRKNDFTA